MLGVVARWNGSAVVVACGAAEAVGAVEARCGRAGGVGADVEDL